MYGVVHADVGTDAEEIMMQTLACPDVDADADVDSNVDADAHAHADADVDADDGVAAAAKEPKIGRLKAIWGFLRQIKNICCVRYIY